MQKLGTTMSIALWLLVPISSASAQTATTATSAPDPKLISRISSLANVASALTSTVGTIGTLVSSVEKLVSTGSSIIDKRSARKLVDNLNDLSAATARTHITQQYVIRSMDEYIRLWEDANPQDDEYRAKHLRHGWGDVKTKVRNARKSIIQLDKRLLKISGPFVRDPSYGQLYAAITSRKELLSRINLEGPDVLTAGEVDALRELSKAYTALNVSLQPAVDNFNAYIDRLEKAKQQGG